MFPGGSRKTLVRTESDVTDDLVAVNTRLIDVRRWTPRQRYRVQPCIGHCEIPYRARGRYGGRRGRWLSCRFRCGGGRWHNCRGRRWLQRGCLNTRFHASNPVGQSLYPILVIPSAVQASVSERCLRVGHGKTLVRTESDVTDDLVAVNTRLIDVRRWTPRQRYRVQPCIGHCETTYRARDRYGASCSCRLSCGCDRGDWSRLRFHCRFDHGGRGDAGRLVPASDDPSCRKQHTCYRPRYTLQCETSSRRAWPSERFPQRRSPLVAGCNLSQPHLDPSGTTQGQRRTLNGLPEDGGSHPWKGMIPDRTGTRL